VYLGGVFIGTDHRDSEIGQTGRKHSGEISRSINSYMHNDYLNRASSTVVEDVLQIPFGLDAPVLRLGRKPDKV
jgi:hypothetical protein